MVDRNGDKVQPFHVGGLRKTAINISRLTWPCVGNVNRRDNLTDLELDRVRPGLKQFVGMVALVVFVIVYAFFAMIVGTAMEEKSTVVQVSYFLVAGLIWVVPAGFIISWMARKPK